MDAAAACSLQQLFLEAADRLTSLQAPPTSAYVTTAGCSRRHETCLNMLGSAAVAIAKRRHLANYNTPEYATEPLFNVLNN